MDKPDSISGVIDLLASRGLLESLGLKPSHARAMKTRNAIPVRWHLSMVEAARLNGLPIDYELLAKLAASKRRAGRAKINEQSDRVGG